MAQTITPVVHGGSRKRWAGSVVLHILGATMTAGMMGALLGSAGKVLGAPWGRGGLLVGSAIALAYFGREAFGLSMPIPELRWQVPEWWRGTFGVRQVAFMYGLALGPGFFTHLRHGTLVAVAAVAVALGDPLLGVALLAPFGLARAAGIAFTSAARTEEALRAAGDRVERLGIGPLPRLANAGVLFALALTGTFTSAGSGRGTPWLWPAVLAATFGWAALAKLLRREAWREALRAHALPISVERAALPLIPAAEMAVALLFLTGQARAAAIAALVMLAAFSAALMRTRKLTPDSLPCGCFGGRARRSFRWMLTRNLGLAAFAILALAERAPIPIHPPDGPELVAAALAGVGLGLAGLVLRQSARLWSGEEIRPEGAN